MAGWQQELEEALYRAKDAATGELKRVLGSVGGEIRIGDGDGQGIEGTLRFGERRWLQPVVLLGVAAGAYWLGTRGR